MARWPTTPSIAAYEKFPSAKLLPSEGCNCPGVKDSDLLRSERYAHDMLRVLKSGACGWVDWNLLLDYTGGPNHLGNDCDAPIHARRNFDGVVVQSYLDVISHFSKHILPGSQEEYKRTCEAPSTKTPKSQRLARPSGLS